MQGDVTALRALCLFVGGVLICLTAALFMRTRRL